MTVKIAAKLTRERSSFNGLDRLQEELVDQPHGTRYAVVAYEVLRTTVEIEEGITVPTVQITHIEPVRDATADTVKEILAGAYKDRTGKALDEEPASLFDVVPGDGDERVVPEPSGEELLAEHRERKAAEAESDGAA
nr:hypothetical protein [Micromonospora sp. DSM 115978]